MNAVTPTTKRENPLAILQQELTSREEGFAAALPPHIPVAKFMRVALTAFLQTPDLGNCTKKSVIAECMKAASDGLVLDGREAVLLVFNNKITKKNEPDKWEKAAKYIPMYQGLMKLSRNSGDISTLSAVLVHKNDKFSYNPGVDEVPNHEPDWFGVRGEPIGVYAVGRLKDGTAVVEVMSEAQIMKIAAKTKNAHQYDKTKGDSYGEWWRKCVIRRISKYLPSSTDRNGDKLLEAIRNDDDLYETDEAPATDAGQPPKAKRKERRAAGILAQASNGKQEPDRENAEEIDPETGEVIEHNESQSGRDDDSAEQEGDEI